MIGEFLKEYRGLHSVSGNAEAADERRLSIDSRSLQPGELFLALRGEAHDGHDYIAAALEKGAAAVVAEKKWWEKNRAAQAFSQGPLIVVGDSLDFLQQLAAWRRRQFDIEVVGLTGSNGKTTTREMIAAVLATRFRVFQSQGNKNNHIGLPLMLLQLGEQTEMAVLEMGMNHPGEIALLAGLAKPTAALVTNVGKAHLGFMGSLEAIYREKISLFEALEPSAPIFLNMEDRFLRNYPRAGRKAITVGYNSGNDVRGRVEFIDRYGRVRFRLNDAVSIQLKVPGTHQVLNALLAAAVGLQYGVSESEAAQALENFAPAKQRMEILEKNGIVFINDAYNANPDSMRAALNYLAGLRNGRGKRIAVLGDMLELGEFAETEHRRLGEFLAEKPVDLALLYGPLSGFILQGFEEKAGRGKRAFHYRTHEEIAAHLQQVLQPHDVVLLKGSRGMKMEKVLEAF